MKVKVIEAMIITVTMRLFLMILVGGIALTTSMVPLINLALLSF